MKIKQMGCHSVHIGGGEPFLNQQGLEKVLEVASGANMAIEYIETNSSWFKDEKQAVQLLAGFRALGLSTLLVSISPFHNEFIPFKKVKGVISACRRAGISVFPWIQDFYPELDAMDENTVHRLEEYCDIFGADYIRKIPSRYWVNLGGRAIQTYKSINALLPLHTILSTGPCYELAQTSHFHADLFGNYIPGLCSGFAIQLEDLGKPIGHEKYPLINMLYAKGIKRFLEFAQNEYSFIPGDKYLSKCHLCFDIRHYLVTEHSIGSVELKPEEFYMEIS